MNNKHKYFLGVVVMQQEQKRILVVNDEKDMLDQIQKWLGIAGYFVECTLTAEDGIKRFGQNDFDLILLDYHLKKESSGARTAKTFIPHFKKLNPTIPIVIISATVSDLNKDELGVAAVFILHRAIWRNLSNLIKETLSN
jgi:CheY-like chemotaxis protein